MFLFSCRHEGAYGVAYALLVAKKINSDGGVTRIDTDCFYTTLGNVYYVYIKTRNYLYGTARSDYGPQHFAIKKPKLNYGEFFSSILQPTYATNNFSEEILYSCMEFFNQIIPQHWRKKLILEEERYLRGHQEITHLLQGLKLQHGQLLSIQLPQGIVFSAHNSYAEVVHVFGLLCFVHTAHQ